MTSTSNYKFKIGDILVQTNQKEFTYKVVGYEFSTAPWHAERHRYKLIWIERGSEHSVGQSSVEYQCELLHMGTKEDEDDLYI